MSSLEERVEIQINKVDNGRCADCFGERPANAVILIGGIEKPMGAFVCFRCARVHENFPNDLGYVLNARNEDNWSEEEVQALERGGNKIVNAIFESKIAFDHPRPDTNSHHEAREKFCTEKYVERLFFSESKASKMLKSNDKQTSGRFTLKAAAKDTGSARGILSSESQKGFNSSDSSFGTMSFSDASFGGEEDDGGAEASMNQLSLDQAEPKRPRQRVRSRRRLSVGGNDPGAPQAGGPPNRTMSLQIDGTTPPPPVRRQRSGRRASLGRTSSMGGSNHPSEDQQQQQQQPGQGGRMRRAGRRGSIGNSNHGSSNNLSRGSGSSSGNLRSHGSANSLTESNHGGGRQRRAGRKGAAGPLGSMLSASCHGVGGEGDMKSIGSQGSGRRLGKKDPLGGSSHHGGGRRRPVRRGSIGVEDANAKLNEKREMVW